MASDSDITFAELDGLGSVPPAPDDQWPLEEWYARVRRTPLSELSVGDLAVACRQRMWLEYVVPRSLAVLDEHFQAGELYDGELAVALTMVPLDFWKNNLPLAQSFRTKIAEGMSGLDHEEAKKLRRFHDVLHSQLG